MLANSPFGGVSIAAIFFVLPNAPPMGQKDTWKGWNRHMLWDVAHLDWFGAAIILAWSTCFILALQWGVRILLSYRSSWANANLFLACCCRALPNHGKTEVSSPVS
jgi:hypothetical protein